MARARRGSGKKEVPASFPVVGIGASAGGLAPIVALLERIPPTSGMSFIVVPHLKPDNRSHMVEILRPKIKLPIEEATEGTQPKPNHVYVIPPNRYLTMSDGALHLVEPQEPRGFRRPIDLFMHSLAQDMRHRAICIILSGTGTNGAAGVRTIKAEGGLVLVQDPETAEFAGMPQASIATNLADLVLAPEDMPAALDRITKHSYIRNGDEKDFNGEARQIETLLSLLHTRVRQDFRAYKKKTLLRRIHRRMGLTGREKLGDYIKLLRENSDEVTALVRDLMISVTGFFRDAQSWEELRTKVIEPLVRDRTDDQPIRVWVPGCATGEESYTIAILILEAMADAQKNLDVKIFATDSSEEVLAYARNGVYPAAIASEVTEARLDRYFVRDEDTFRVAKAVRDAVTFAPQNVLRDPPFTRMDLVSCRNLMIYLEPEVQRKLVSLFHFALRENAHLFLGTAETVTGQEQLFATVSKKWRIYRRIGATRHDLVQFPLIGSLGVGFDGAGQGGHERRPRPRIGDVARDVLVDTFAPASVIIDQQFHIHYFHGDTDRYLRQPPGEPTSDLLMMARDILRTKLRGLILAVVKSGEPTSTVLNMGRGGDRNAVRVMARRLRENRFAEDLLLVSFQQEEPGTVAPGNALGPKEAENAEVLDLESEMKILREELQGTIEQMESSHEELKASNEEVMSMNEELQSANEELETSKEELQSLNEELNTVNAQLQAKVDELENRTNDLNNLLNGTDIATLFLDTNMRIRWFTPAMRRLMELLPTDVGRPVGNFSHCFTNGGFVGEAEAVLQKLVPLRTEVQSEDGRWFVRDILPYRTEDNRIDGTVITFTDITKLKAVQQELVKEKDYAEKIVETASQPLLVLESNLRVRSANKAFYQHFKTKPDATVGRLIFDLGDKQWDSPKLRELLEKVLPGDSRFHDFEVEHEFPKIGRRIFRVSGCRLDDTQLVLLAFDDLTEERSWARRQKMLTQELNHRVKNLMVTVRAIASQTLRRSSSLDEFADTFRGRIRALSEGHDLLTRHQWMHTRLSDVAAAALGPHHPVDEKRFSVDCKDVVIGSGGALALSLVLHELATNAIKYGALSNSSGRVSLACTPVDGAKEVRLEWREHGGPAVGKPGKDGFGFTFIRRIVKHELDGDVAIVLGEDGLQCTITFVPPPRYI